MYSRPHYEATGSLMASAGGQGTAPADGGGSRRQRVSSHSGSNGMAMDLMNVTLQAVLLVAVLYGGWR